MAGLSDERGADAFGGPAGGAGRATCGSATGAYGEHGHTYVETQTRRDAVADTDTGANTENTHTHRHRRVEPATLFKNSTLHAHTQLCGDTCTRDSSGIPVPGIQRSDTRTHAAVWRHLHTIGEAQSCPYNAVTCLVGMICGTYDWRHLHTKQFRESCPSNTVTCLVGMICVCVFRQVLRQVVTALQR